MTIEVTDMKENLVDTITTNEKGIAVSTAKVGIYKLSEKIEVNGEIVRISS
ncbi:hypothetical protein AAK894_04700 [Lachnospiraceae bacterium 46-61]